jgi:hypothetical protein
MVRLFVDRVKRQSEAETGPGVLLSSGYIAGGSIAGVLIAFLSFDMFRSFTKTLDVGSYEYFTRPLSESNWATSLAAFGLLIVVLAMTGLLASFQDRRTPRGGGK